MKWTLQKKFFLILSCLFIIMVAGMQGWNYKKSLDEVKRNESAQMKLTNSLVNQKISEQMEVAKHSLLSIVHNPEVQRLFAEHDRNGLYQMMDASFSELKKDGINQLQFHTPDSRSFLRVHQPDKYGDDLSAFRKTVVDANTDQKMIVGLEEGVGGYGFRVVAPVTYNEKHVGTAEVGSDFGSDFLKSIKNDIQGDYYIYSFSTETDSYLASTTTEDPYAVDPAILKKVQSSGKVTHTYSENEKQTIMLIPFKDYHGEIKGYIKGVISREATVAHMNSLRTNAILTGFISLILVMAVTYFIITPITRSIRKVAESLDQVADGDLTIEKVNVSSKDEIGVLANALNSMIDRLRSTLQTVSNASEQVAAASEELTASAEQTSQASEQISVSAQMSAERTDQQLQSIIESSGTLQEMSAGLQQISGNSQVMSSKTAEVSQAIQTGNQSVVDVVNEMNSIHRSVDQLSEVIAGLGKQSKEIGNIVKLITDISQQTNLLALNAAIEAARAGEHGRGFAVVADEVRKLAEQSAASATQITELIGSIQTETEKAVGAMHENTSKVNTGLTKTQLVKEAFQSIESSITAVTQVVDEVAASVEQMAAGSDQIVNAIEEIKQSAEVNAGTSQENSAASQEQMAAMEEISASSQSLAKLAEELQTELNRFRI